MNRRLVAALAGLVVASFAAPATAVQPTQVTQFDQWVEPGPASGCPAHLTTDFAHIVGDGHGLDAQALLANGDFRATSTFIGAATTTFYDPADVDVVYGPDGIESATPTGAPDVVVDGTLKQTFHVSQNQQTTTMTITFALHFTDPDGTSVHVHGENHGTWLPGSNPETDPPTLTTSRTSC